MRMSTMHSSYFEELATGFSLTRPNKFVSILDTNLVVRGSAALRSNMDFSMS